MTDILPPRDDDRFEEVLGRLDALVRRGQPDYDPPPPPPAVSEATIPVLTEVYQPEAEIGTGIVEPAVELSAEEQLEQAMAMVLPIMAETVGAILEETVRPELEQTLRQTLAELRPQMEELLRQRLRQALTRSET